MPNCRSGLPMMITSALKGCNPVSILSDRPHHYQVSAPLRDKGKGRCALGEKQSAAPRVFFGWGQLSTYEIQMQGQVCCDRAVSDQVHLYLFRRNVEEVMSDSRWGCGPIRAGLLEDDEWGCLLELQRNTCIGRLEMPTAVSLNENKHAEGLLYTE